MIITRTPYRVSFFGGGTDYRPWFEKHGGLVIASAMARYNYLTLRHLPPFFEHKTRVVYGKEELVLSNQEILHPAVQHCLAYLNIEEGLDIHHVGDLPARSGIGSSSSFTVGLLHALYALRYKMVTKKTLADEAIYVEQERIKEDVGIQDQIMAANGGIQVIEMGPGDQYTVVPLLLTPDYIEALEQHVLLAFTGFQRYANRYAKAQIQNIEEGKSLNHLTEIQDITKEALTVFSQGANLEEIGKLLDASWQIKRNLAQHVSNNAIDDLYTIGKKTGAFGGKLMGAGGGGFVMFLAPPYRHEALKQALPQVKVWVPFKIDFEGSTIIFYNQNKIA